MLENNCESTYFLLFYITVLATYSLNLQEFDHLVFQIWHFDYIFSFIFKSFYTIFTPERHRFQPLINKK